VFSVEELSDGLATVTVQIDDEESTVRFVVSHHVEVPNHTDDRLKERSQVKQESCAIAKMTAQCAIYMGALKIFGTP